MAVLSNFVDQVTTVDASWLNGVDLTINQGLGGNITPATIAAFLGIPASVTFPIAINQGGTGAETAAGATAALGINQSFIGGLLYPETAIETAAAATPTNFVYPNGPFRYGAVGNGINDDSPAWTTMGKVHGYHFVPTGTYLFQEAAQTIAVCTIEGADRQYTIVESTSFADYVLKIGATYTSGPATNPNLGQVKRLYFQNGKAANLGMLFMEPGSHLWRLDDLIFQTNACPAIVADTIYDSSWTNIDIYSSGGNSAPSTGAAVILKSSIAGNSTNNIYFRGLHIEQCLYGCMYIGPGCAPIHWDTGKIDQGNNLSQVSAAITIDATPSQVLYGYLYVNNWTITGVDNSQYAVVCKGSFKCTNSYWVGGGGAAAHILDERVWSHIDYVSIPGAYPASYAPVIPTIALGDCDFGLADISAPGTTLAAVQSKIPNPWALVSVQVTGTTTSGGNTTVQVSGTLGSANGLYNGCYLVFNGSGTQPAFRRYIIQTYGTAGQLVVNGTGALANSVDYSIEYCGGHYTPNFKATDVVLAAGMTLFAIIKTGVTITSGLTYQLANAGAARGTNFTTSLTANVDYTGYYLVNEQTGEPYLITYGSDGASTLAIPYDRRNDFLTGSTYSIVAGYAHGAQQIGDSLVWYYAGKLKTALISALVAAGFNTENFPVWGFGSTGEPVAIPYAASLTLDVSQTRQAIVNCTSATIAINAPLNACNGDRLLITLKNTSGSNLTLSFNAVFKAGSLPTITTTNGATFEFFYDGTNWRQINTPILVPN